MKYSKYWIIGLTAALWVFVSWFGTGWYAERKTDALFSHNTEMLEGDSLALFQAFEERLNYLSSIPPLIAREPQMIRAVAKYATLPPRSQTGLDPKDFWLSRADLVTLNANLKHLAAALDVDVIFILNAEGYSIAASNTDSPGNIVGTPLRDRIYFKESISGQKSHQYAVGRKTNLPGLYYSVPIMDGGKVQGVLVVKSDIPRFQSLLAPYHTFLTDTNDVIVLASDPAFLQHRLPDARFQTLSPEEKQLQYKQSEFPVLQIQPWREQLSLPLLQLNGLNEPVLMTERQIPGGDLIMHVYLKIPGILTIWNERHIFALFSSLAGFSFATLIYQLIVYLRGLRRSKSVAEAKSEELHQTLSEREQQLDTILNHLPLMVTARDPATNTVLSSNEAASRVLGLSAPLQLGQPYDRSLNKTLRDFLTARDKQALADGSADNTRELKLEDRVLKAQTVVAKDRNDQPRMLIDFVEDISQQRRDEAEIRRLAFIDTLTGLNNRTSLKLYLDKTVSQAVGNQVYGAMILIDLDAFKQINDRFGHSLGDELLKELAHRLISEGTSEVFIARMASDEFVIVINPGSHSLEDAKHSATRISNALLRRITQPYLINQHTLHMTASLGVALFGPRLADSADLLLIQADAAMYEAKRRERGTIQFFDEDTQKYLNAQADMANRLRGALRENDFKQYYQPQVNHQGRVIGVEALLRWHDPKLGQISPATFIPLAESLHLIVDIDRWVLKQACRVAGSWNTDPVMNQVAISINVSGEYFSQDGFLNEVVDYLDQYGARPDQIMIEITEGTLIEDTDANILKIKALHDAGFGTAIDDFGTGNSSLAYLRRFDVDQIKIDQRFVHDMIFDERSRAITTFIVELAHELGYQTLAEGVETEAQRTLLKDMGCTLLQGYLFSEALPLIECETYIHQANTTQAH